MISKDDMTKLFLKLDMLGVRLKEVALLVNESLQEIEEVRKRLL